MTFLPAAFDVACVWSPDCLFAAWWSGRPVWSVSSSSWSSSSSTIGLDGPANCWAVRAAMRALLAARPSAILSDGSLCPETLWRGRCSSVAWGASDKKSAGRISVFVTCHSWCGVLCLTRLLSGTVIGRRAVVVLVEVSCGRLALAFFESAATKVNWSVCHRGLVKWLDVAVDCDCGWKSLKEDGRDDRVWREDSVVKGWRYWRARGLI